MIDQSFSAENFEKIFNIENRKGNINKDTLPEGYIDTILKVKEKKNEISQHLHDYKEGQLTKEQFIAKREECDQHIEMLNLEKEKILYEYLKTISEEVNSSKFKFTFQVGKRHEKPTYELVSSVSQFYAIKQLQYNINKTFKVKQSDRYRILKQIKLLLSDGFPKIIIRTDIESFYESIPQQRLREVISKNTLLTHKSKSFIYSIIEEYDKLKDKSETPGCGVPRGVGISAYLSELYMRDIDSKIKSIDNLTFFARYVDDIFIVITPSCVNEHIDYVDIIRKILCEYGLKMKEAKTETIELLRDADIRGTIKYLGYCFHVCTGPNHCNVKVHLSDTKRTKYKDRLKKAFDDYNVNSKHNEKIARRLLFNRLRFLSRNTNLVNSKKGIKVGVYYSNSLLDVSDLASLRAINGYLKEMVHTNLHPHCTVSFDVEKLKRQIMSQFDFCDGFINKKFHTYTTDELIKINHIWRNEA